MGWLADLTGALVGLDAAPLIYYMERHPRYLHVVKPLFEAFDTGSLQAAASTVVVLEVLVLPIRRQDTPLAQAYRDILLHNDAVTVVAVSPEIAERAAALRAQSSIKTPDALHLATALHMGASHFITNDDRLPQVPGLTIVSLDRLLAV